MNEENHIARAIFRHRNWVEERRLQEPFTGVTLMGSLTLEEAPSLRVTMKVTRAVPLCKAAGARVAVTLPARPEGYWREGDISHWQ
jgi:hypothetical protein